VFTGAPALYAVRAVYLLLHGDRAPGAGRVDLALLLAAFVLTLTLLIVLLSRPRLSMRGLRTIEVLGFGHAVALFTWWVFDQLLNGWMDATGTREAASTAILARFWVLPFFGSIMAYGTLIPNTWRRCASAMALIAVCPLLAVVAAGVCGAPYTVRVLALVVFEMSFWLAIGSGLAIFGAHRMDVLRKRVEEAQMLGQYKLQQRLGGGGMGEVFLAEHVLLRRPCAIKLIRADRAGDPKNLLRFMHEVQATATLSHPNTIQVFDYGQTEDGTFYYVMEYLPGVTLEQLVQDCGRLPPQRAIHFLRQICDALHEAHLIGLIHRDIKPSNVIICQRGARYDKVKLLDFGLALPYRSRPEDETLVREDTLAGTPAYMSPEQAGGNDKLDVRSDIYSIGAVAYFLLTGRSPFCYRSAARTIAAHLYETPLPPSQHCREISADIEALVLRCLAKNAAHRFASVADLERALAACVVGAPWSEEQAAEWWQARSAGNATPIGDPAGKTQDIKTTQV
jgi:eukaryotic-like serine/threonine-protein kinase